MIGKVTIFITCLRLWPNKNTKHQHLFWDRWQLTHWYISYVFNRSYEIHGTLRQPQQSALVFYNPNLRCLDLCCEMMSSRKAVSVKQYIRPWFGKLISAVQHSEVTIKPVCVWRKVFGNYIMMKSSNGSIFRVTGQLCGEFSDHRWIPHTKTSDA